MLSNLLTICRQCPKLVRQEAHRRESRSDQSFSSSSSSRSLRWFVQLRPHKLAVRRPVGVHATLLSKSVFKLVLVGATDRQPRDAHLFTNLVWDWRVRGDES